MHAAFVKLTTFSNKSLLIYLLSIPSLQSSKTQWSKLCNLDCSKLLSTYVVYILIYFESYLSKYPPF